MKTLTGERNQCAGCGEYFNSNRAFDKHRIGKHGVDRRCRTKEEMLAKGMRVNHWGFWVSKANTFLRGEANGERKETSNTESTGNGSEV